MKVLLVVAVAAVCLAGVLAITPCQEHRERELKSNTAVKLIPKCTPEGDYESFQCFQGSPFCMCWRPDGTHIVDPSLKIKTCICHVHRDRELKKAHNGVVGHFIPKCHPSGRYEHKQCHGSTGFCWCVDDKGNKVSKEVQGPLEC